MTDELADHLRLIRTRGIGPVAYRQLLARFGSAAEAIRALPDLARRGGGRPVVLADEREIEREIALVQRLGGHHLLLGRGLYPGLLAAMDSAPAVLVALGDLRLFDRPAVAIVGARNASAAACRFARVLAHDLGGEGIAVVSGLARGIDSAAHDGAMDTGTIGCAAGGVDVYYPPENRERQLRMAKDGLVLSERRPGYEPRAKDFPRRNRIIAGLSSACVVVEAAPRSGSLITARMAAEAGREVLAVPGSPLDPRARGCNQLIRDGATLIQNAADVIEALRPVGEGRVRSTVESFTFAEPEADPDEGLRARIESLLGPSAVPVDDLVRLSEASPGAVQLVLLELDLAGRLERHAGGKVSLPPA